MTVRKKSLALEPQTSLYRAREKCDKRQMPMYCQTVMVLLPFIILKTSKVLVKRAELGTSLSLRELLEISNALRTVRALSDWRKHCEKTETSLDYLFSGLTPHPFIEDRINTAILSEDMVADNAEPGVVRHTKKNTQRRA